MRATHPDTTAADALPEAVNQFSARDERAGLRSHPRAGSASLEGVPALELVEGWKLFGHVTALNNVSFRAHSGAVTAVVGDNGAGKSTLVKVLSGVYRLDQGQLLISGTKVSGRGRKGFAAAGVSTVFQDLALVDTLDVAENMFIDAPLKKARIFLDRAAMYKRAAQTLQDLKVNIPSVRVVAGELSGGQRQIVAIARSVLRESPVIIMDEPTAALGVRETARIGSAIEELKARGCAVVLVSHDLEFVFEHADVIQVMRLGRVQGRVNVDQTDRETVIGMITGLTDGSKWVTS